MASITVGAIEILAGRAAPTLTRLAAAFPERSRAS